MSLSTSNNAVLIVVPAKIDKSEELETPEVIQNHSLTLSCATSGNPQPKITWFRNSLPINSNTSNYHILEGGAKFHILRAQVADSTRFSCKGKNVAGEEEKKFDVKVLGTIFTIVVMCIVFYNKLQNSLKLNKYDSLLIVFKISSLKIGEKNKIKHSPYKSYNANTSRVYKLYQGQIYISNEIMKIY